MKYKLLRFHFQKQTYQDFLAILPYNDEILNFYGLETQTLAVCNSALGCHNAARKFSHFGLVEKDAKARVKTILEAESEASKLTEKQNLEWKEHRRKFQSVKYK